MTALRLAGDPLPPGYDATDRVRDFRRALADTAEGRQVLSQILARCRVWDRSYVPGDTHETARREGMRDVGLWILTILESDPADRDPTAESDAVPEVR